MILIAVSSTYYLFVVLFQIGSGPSSSLQNSMTSQTASNVSALVSLQQNALQDNLVTELTGNSLTGSGLTGNGLVGTSLGNSLTTSLPVNNLTSLSGELSGTSGLSGSNVCTTGTFTSQSGTSLVPGSSAAGSIPTSSVSQNAMLQRAKPQRSKLPPPSKVKLRGLLTQVNTKYLVLKIKE